MSDKTRYCPYCKQELKRRPYWKHIQEVHPKEFESDTSTWIQLFKDYSTMGMNKAVSLQVIAEIFNKSPKFIEDFLKEQKVL
ncbi:hypothetical protein DSAG12_02402 [Promethearchaeum syntrophicum]|uniref:Uncharacterized protein n=1 Tax=Promethearchaeum syntrophicum TaxID=2594042 RepID=A0A5B9DBR8_9ARCH|nr:hypothetical protein [Candidatus Prometheoarchaeum syntrophicum]QEE16572.1 hypothetical protein DSAG12_02402 [Candidatus Prometheoarchaeum syntrophicum]